MQLRDHPTFLFRGFNLWPPTWIGRVTCPSAPIGEVGVLRDVQWHPDIPLRVLLTMELEGANYQSRLLMENDLISMVMVSLLEDCKGMTIESIGSLEVPVRELRSANLIR